MWFEVRSGGPDGRIIEFGAFPNEPVWFFPVRHLGTGTNVIDVYGVAADETLVSTSARRDARVTRLGVFHRLSKKGRSSGPYVPTGH